MATEVPQIPDTIRYETEEQYFKHADWPNGVRFMLFQTPDGMGYVRASTEQNDHHEDIVAAFRREIETVLAGLEVLEKGGGFYRFRDNDPATGALLSKPRIVFQGESTVYRRFNSVVLRKILTDCNLAATIDWSIEE